MRPGGCGIPGGAAPMFINDNMGRGAGGSAGAGPSSAPARTGGGARATPGTGGLCFPGSAGVGESMADITCDPDTTLERMAAADVLGLDARPWSLANLLPAFLGTVCVASDGRLWVGGKKPRFKVDRDRWELKLTVRAAATPNPSRLLSCFMVQKKGKGYFFEAPAPIFLVHTPKMAAIAAILSAVSIHHCVGRADPDDPSDLDKMIVGVLGVPTVAEATRLVKAALDGDAADAVLCFAESFYFKVLQRCAGFNIERSQGHQANQVFVRAIEAVLGEAGATFPWAVELSKQVCPVHVGGVGKVAPTYYALDSRAPLA